ncbi:MAG: exodeoxyribonuclease large subunit [Phycisphaerales bacterium]|nr:exodeoxyribonuclease large subunit [Phycisphaerales bacterium]
MTESFFDFRARLTQRPEPAPPSIASGSAAKPLSVSQLTRQIDRALKENLPPTFLVKAEVSNFNHHAGSGHFYFTLKDKDACIDCVMFRSDAERVKFQPKDGMELLASGNVKVYAQRGKYQLYVSSLQPLGQGALELAFQQLRAKLEGEGLFDEDRKKPLPEFPMRIALVTAAQAAALHDMLKVLRRFSWLKLMVYPVPVQGDGAAERIAAALKHLNRRAADVGGVDVIILGRGGGSLEDLWAFNEEIVARAVAASKIPIVTGVGHEVDVSIADLVADYHAHTPTEAAQVVAANWRGIGEAISMLNGRLSRVLRDRLTAARTHVDGLVRHEFFRRPLHQVNSLRQLVDERHRELIVTMNRRVWDLQRVLREMEESLSAHSPQTVVARLAQRLIGHQQRLRYAAAVQFERRSGRVEAMERELRALSPDSVLRRGFSMTTLKKDGTVVRSANQIKGGEKLTTRLADGTIDSIAEDPKQPKLF